MPGAVNYNVFRTEGYITDGTDKCAFGKALVGTTSSLTFTDTEVANNRAYSYVVVAEGTNDACFGPASNCTTVEPQPCAGSVSIDKTAYTCSDAVNIAVVDSDLIGAGTQNVTATAGSDTETVLLTENPPNSGTFQGSINTSGSGGSSGDGTLNVVDGDTITITYSDQSFCGPPQDVVVTAIADCVVPAISNVQASNVNDQTATITWDTNENANSRVTYAVAPGPPSTNVDDPLNYVTSHSILLTGLSPCTDYVFFVFLVVPSVYSVRMTTVARSTRSQQLTLPQYSLMMLNLDWEIGLLVVVQRITNGMSVPAKVNHQQAHSKQVQLHAQVSMGTMLTSH